jgi:hypothetical protein
MVRENSGQKEIQVTDSHAASVKISHAYYTGILHAGRFAFEHSRQPHLTRASKSGSVRVRKLIATVHAVVVESKCKPRKHMYASNNKV